jgi:hypothetical protein
VSGGPAEFDADGIHEPASHLAKSSIAGKTVRHIRRLLACVNREARQQDVGVDDDVELVRA